MASSNADPHSTSELFKQDLYALLGVSCSASDSDIKKAYRKQALKCHPDKNPDNPQAAGTFLKLCAVFEVLVNKETRCEYDQIIKARQATAERNYQLDSKRRKLKDDLERREREAASAAMNTQKHKESGLDEKEMMENLNRLLKDLRANGSTLLEKEQKLLREELSKNETVNGDNNIVYRLKIKWKKDAQPQYNEKSLRELLCKYGEIGVVVISTKKVPSSAIVEFVDGKSAAMAFKHESGFSSNKLLLEWVGCKPPECFDKFDMKFRNPMSTTEHPSEKRDSRNDGTIDIDPNFNIEQEEEELFAKLRKAAQTQKESQKQPQQQESL